MSVRNPGLAHRPLRPSTLVYNPLAQEAGSIGCFAKDGAGDHWLVSCHHVLSGAGPAMPQPIYQPDDSPGAVPVADFDGTKADAAFDVAAAKLRPGVAFENDWLGLGSGNLQAATPVKGMRVVKCGSRTGVTEGEVVDVEADRVKIGLRAGAPIRSELSAAGDSGAMWLEHGSLRPVGIHYLGNAGGAIFAYARPIDAVLLRLALSLT